MVASIRKTVDRIDAQVDTLESALGTFIVSTNAALLRLEREMREFKEEMRGFKDESERDRKRMNKQWGDLANKMGTLVEDIVAPNIPRVAKEYFGVEDLDFFAVRVAKRNARIPDLKRAFDVIAVSKGHFFLNKTKATPRANYIDGFVETLGEIDDWFPEYRDKALVPIFSSLSISEELVKYLTRKKIYAMGMKDDTMHIANFEDVNARSVG